MNGMERNCACYGGSTDGRDECCQTKLLLVKTRQLECMAEPPENRGMVASRAVAEVCCEAAETPGGMNFSELCERVCELPC